MALKLFKQIGKGLEFFFGDRLDRKLVKVDDEHAVGPDGNVKRVHPDVLVFEPKRKANGGTDHIMKGG